MDIPPRIARHTLKDASVLVMGDVMLDRYWFGDVNRISPEAPVPIALIQKEDYRLGGAANVARNITSLGGGAILAGVVGKDKTAAQLEQLLKTSHIQSCLIHDEAISTTLKLRVIGHSQQLLRIDFENAPSESHLAQLENIYRQALPSSKVVVFSDYGKGALENIEGLIKQAQGKLTLVDPKGRDYARYRGATILTPNRAELKAVIGDWENETMLEQRVQNLRIQMEWQYLILTRSEEGITLFSNDGSMIIPAQQREVFDVSGAGDTVIATLALMLACNIAIVPAIKLANRAAGIVVGRMGTAAISADELWTE